MKKPKFENKYSQFRIPLTNGGLLCRESRPKKEGDRLGGNGQKQFVIPLLRRTVTFWFEVTEG